MKILNKISVFFMVIASIVMNYGICNASVNIPLSANDYKVKNISVLIFKLTVDTIPDEYLATVNYSVWASIVKEMGIYFDYILPQKLAKEFNADELDRIEPQIMLAKQFGNAGHLAAYKVHKEISSNADSSMRENSNSSKKSSDIYDKRKIKALCKKKFIVDTSMISTPYMDLIDKTHSDKLFISAMKNDYKIMCATSNNDGRLDDRAESYARYFYDQYKQTITEMISEKEYREMENFNKTSLGIRVARLMKEVDGSIKKLLQKK